MQNKKANDTEGHSLSGIRKIGWTFFFQLKKKLHKASQARLENMKGENKLRSKEKKK